MARNMKCSDTGKDVHFTAAAAKRAADHWTEERSIRLGTYRCPHCHFWHLTHRPTRWTQREARV